MRRFLPVFLAISIFQGFSFASDPVPATAPTTPTELAALEELTTPGGQIKLWLSMARKDDFTPIGTLIPASEWVYVERAWKMMLSKQGPEADAQLDKELAQLSAPQALDTIMKTLTPRLTAFKPEQLAMVIRGFSAMFAQQAAKPGTEPANDPALQGFLSWCGDIATYVEQSAGINDPQKTRTALAALIAGIADLKVANAKEIRQTSLKEMLPRFGAASAHLKEAFRAYDIDLNAIIDSIKIVRVNGASVRSLVTLSMNVFNRERRLDIDLIKRGSTWEIVGFKGQPFLPFAAALDPLLKSMGIGNGVKDKAPVTPQDERPPGTL